MPEHSRAEIEAANDEVLTEWLIELIQSAKSHGKWNRKYAEELGCEVAKRPGLRDLLGSLKEW